jgi:hypothetical protein
MTVIDPRTLPDQVEGRGGAAEPWQVEHATLDLLPQPKKRVIASPSISLSDGSNSADPQAASNVEATTAPPALGAAKHPAILGEPLVVLEVDSGRRSLRALMHWEGVVERLEGNGFRARLTPFRNGAADPAQVEFTDFSMDDLANREDRSLVKEGARFYWTIGRATNDAGTLFNVSLVRFRRLAPITSHRRRLAEAEADAVLRHGTES